MATYKEIRGTHIVSVTSDPPSPVNGQMWYNSTDRVVKGFTSNPVGSWATGGSLNTAAVRGWGFGQKDSALAFGGYLSGAVNRTEQYNGTSWTEVNDLNAARWDLSGMGYGDNTAGLAIGGQPSTGIVALNESWNGSSWTETTDVNTGRANAIGVGTQTSGLFFGGITNNPTDVTADNEYWNGSSWTELNNLNQGKYGIGGSGTQTAALAAGGAIPPDANTANTELWNGTSWAEQNNLNTATSQMASGGTTSAGFVAGGGYSPPVIAKTEEWNGAGVDTTREFDLS